MRSSNLPQPAGSRLLNLTELVDSLVSAADSAESTMLRSREIINGRAECSPEQFKTARAQFDSIYAESKAARVKADSGRAVLASCRSWVEQLAHNCKLLVVTPAINGVDLGELQGKLKELRAELHTINHTTPIADDIGDRVQAYVNDLASRGAPFVHGFGANEGLDVRWGDGIDPDPRNGNTLSANGLLMAALLNPTALSKVILDAVKKAQPIPKAALDNRRAEVTSRLDELSYSIAAMLDRSGEPPDPLMEARHHLGVRIKAESPVSAETVKHMTADQKDILSTAMAKAIRSGVPARS